MPSSEIGRHGVSSATGPEQGPYSNASPTFTNASTDAAAAHVHERDRASEVRAELVVGRRSALHACIVAAARWYTRSRLHSIDKRGDAACLTQVADVHR